VKPASAVERVAWLLVCLLAFSLPVEKAITVEGIGTISRAIGLVAFLAGAAVVARRRFLRAPNAALLLAALFVAWSCLTWFWSVAPPMTADRAATLAQLLAMTWLIWELSAQAVLPVWLMQSYLAGAAVSAVLTMLRYSQGQQTYWRRYATAGFDPNDLGVTLALALPMALYLSARARNWTAWLYRLATPLVIAAILLTASRTALVAAYLAFAFVLLYWRGTHLGEKLTSLGLLALLILGPISLAPPAARERLATLPTEVTRGTLHGRTQIWKAGLRAFKGAPIAGVGAGAYPEAVRPWLGTPTVRGHVYTAHNTFLSVLVETGAVGFLIFASLLASLLVFLWMMHSAERALWLTSLLVWVAGVSTLTWENRKPTWLLFALLMAAWSHAFTRKAAER
jgi:O-antigen ligase